MSARNIVGIGNTEAEIRDDAVAVARAEVYGQYAELTASTQFHIIEADSAVWATATRDRAKQADKRFAGTVKISDTGPAFVTYPGNDDEFVRVHRLTLQGLADTLAKILEAG